MKTKTIGTRMKYFLRGMGSIIDLQPSTRRMRTAEKMAFTRTVFIGGRKIQLDAKRDPFEAVAEAYASSWQRVSASVEKVIGKLPSSAQDHAERELTSVQ